MIKAELDGLQLPRGSMCITCGTKLHRLLLEAGQQWHDGDCDPTPLPRGPQPAPRLHAVQLQVDTEGATP